MGIGWLRGRGRTDGAEVARTRWEQAAESLTDRFSSVDHLPLAEAVEVVLMAAPAHWSREELTRRIAARRGIDPTQA